MKLNLPAETVDEAVRLYVRDQLNLEASTVTFVRERGGDGAVRAEVEVESPRLATVAVSE